MALTEHIKMICKIIKDIVPAFTSGIVTVSIISCVLFAIQTCLSLKQGIFSIGASVFQNGHLYCILMFPFYHRTFAQLLLNITTLVFLSGSLEKGVGTVRFLFLFLLLSSIIGLFYSFMDLLQEDGFQGHTEGLVPVTLASVAITTMHTKMTKAFLCGVSFPTMALPWVFLVITTALVPHCVLPCNVIAILVGVMYGKGWVSFLDMSEAKAGVLEKLLPFRLFRTVSGDMFIPASSEDRKKTLLPQINPTSGSYPVQAYAPLPTANTAAMTYEGWPHQASPTPPLSHHGHVAGHSSGHFSPQSFDHSCNHSHSHGHGHSHGHSHGHKSGGSLLQE